jgi:hypothetical protein
MCPATVTLPEVTITAARGPTTNRSARSSTRSSRSPNTPRLAPPGAISTAKRTPPITPAPGARTSRSVMQSWICPVPVSITSTRSTSSEAAAPSVSAVASMPFDGAAMPQCA